MKNLNIINNDKLNLQALMELSQRPPVFTPGEELFWTDEHISKGMLEAHLSQYTDAASRKAETIEKTVSFLADYLKLNDEKAVLDIGCGPGLYCAKFDNYCNNVTGMDFSKRSIDYAINYSKENNLNIKYILENYLNMDFNEEFEAIFLIYCDLGPLSDTDRDNLLGRIYKALKPGGYFVFDIFTKHNKKYKEEKKDWYCEVEGFWKPCPHLVLESSFHYDEHDTWLDQYIVIEESGKTSTYRVYDHYYSKESISEVLNAQGFEVEAVWSDLAGSPYYAESPLMGIAARKK